jgi:hypothetical protein
LRITNKHGLPKTLVKLVENDGYSKGKSKISVTSLISPPRIVQLRKRFDGEIEIDVADRIWIIFGRAMHMVLEQGGDETHLPEERLFARVLDWDISGAVDLQVVEQLKNSTAVDIIDYKSTSVWSVIFGKTDWINQLNCYAWLVRQIKSYTVKRLRVIAFLKDWDRKDAALNRDYPPTAIHTLDIPLWSFEEQTRYVEERVRLHQEAEMAAVFDEPLPECTEEEQWTRNSAWTVMRKGGKRASRVLPDTPEGKHDAELIALRLNEKGGKPYDVVRRIGHRNRCEGNYCSVAPFCEQWARQNQPEEIDDLEVAALSESATPDRTASEG